MNGVDLGGGAAAADLAGGRLGRRIREIRRARGLTLVQLAEASALSHPFLSQLERGLTSPSITSLERIARALGSSQVELFALTVDEIPVGQLDSDVSVVRADEGVAGPFAEGSARVLVRGARQFNPLEFTGENAEFGDYYVHAEDEFITVLAGDVRLDLDGSSETSLSVGDSVYYPGGTSHRWCRPGGGRYRLLIVKQRIAADSASLPTADRVPQTERPVLRAAGSWRRTSLREI